MTPYEKRPIRFLDLFEVGGWSVKTYGISARADRPGRTLVLAAKTVAAERLPLPAVTDDRYGAAMLIVHEGREANFVLVDWWVGGNMLQHHVYLSPIEEPARLDYISPTGIAACIWELHILAFERQAWIETVLANPHGPSLPAYFARRLDTDI